MGLQHGSASVACFHVVGVGETQVRHFEALTVVRIGSSRQRLGPVRHPELIIIYICSIKHTTDYSSLRTPWKVIELMALTGTPAAMSDVPDNFGVEDSCSAYT